MLKKSIIAVSLLGTCLVVAGCTMHGDVGIALDNYHECGKYKPGSQEYSDCLERLDRNRQIRGY